MPTVSGAGVSQKAHTAPAAGAAQLHALVQTSQADVLPEGQCEACCSTLLCKHNPPSSCPSCQHSMYNTPSMPQ